MQKISNILLCNKWLHYDCNSNNINDSIIYYETYSNKNFKNQFNSYVGTNWLCLIFGNFFVRNRVH